MSKQKKLHRIVSVYMTEQTGNQTDELSDHYGQGVMDVGPSQIVRIAIDLLYKSVISDKKGN